MQAVDDIGLFAAQGDDEDGQIGAQLLARPGGHFRAAGVGQLPIQNQQIKTFAAQVFGQLRPGGVAHTGVAHAVHHLLHHVQLLGVIFQNGDAHGAVLLKVIDMFFVAITAYSLAA